MAFASPAEEPPRAGVDPSAGARAVQVEVFDFFSCPGGSPEEFQTRRDARIDLKAANIDQLSELLPAVPLDERVDDRGEGDTVQRIVLAPGRIVLRFAHSGIV